MQQQDLKAIGARVKTIREDLELKQEEFAKELNVNKKTISLLENGHRRPGQELLSLLSHKYNVNLDWVNSGKDEKYNTKEANPKSSDNMYAKIISLEMELAEVREMLESLLGKLK